MVMIQNIKPWIDGHLHRITRAAKMWDSENFCQAAGITIKELERFEKGKKMPPEFIEKIKKAWK